MDYQLLTAFAAGIAFTLFVTWILPRRVQDESGVIDTLTTTLLEKIDENKELTDRLKVYEN